MAIAFVYGTVDIVRYSTVQCPVTQTPHDDAPDAIGHTRFVFM